MNQVIYYSLEIVFVLLSSFLFLFVYYRKLKEDFLPSQIFRDGTLILFCTGVGALISFFIAQQLWFWLSTIGFIIGLIFALIRSRIPILEGLEAASLGALWLLLFYYVFQLITKPTIPEWVGFGGIILTFLIYLFFTFNYKKFTWYR